MCAPLYPREKAADRGRMQRAVALPAPRARRALALSRVAGWRALMLVVGISTVVRGAAAFARQTPMYFPDEYMYSELGRSISTGGRTLVRGTETTFPPLIQPIRAARAPLVPGPETTFPALLQPILTAPAWLLGDVATAYHAIQVANALAMSLAA